MSIQELNTFDAPKMTSHFYSTPHWEVTSVIFIYVVDSKTRKIFW